jgi:hypothetical protein
VTQSSHSAKMYLVWLAIDACEDDHADEAGNNEDDA